MSPTATMRLSPSDELLLLAARVDPSRGVIDRIEEVLREDIDWTYVVDASIRNAVTPLLARTLQAVDASLVPADVTAEIRELRVRSGIRNRRILREVAEVCAGLAERGVHVVGLKDLYLGPAVYGDSALRPMGDVDLLIAPDDYPAAAEVLRALGFEALPNDTVPFVRKYGAGQQFRRAADDLWIDVQWRIAERAADAFDEPGLSYRVDEVRATARPMRLHDIEIPVPSVEEMLLHLCLHLDGHRYSELILLTDIAELLRAEGESLDRERFVRRVREERGESAVYYVLLLAAALLDAPLPDGLLQAIDPPYWQGDMLQALFGELTMLHVALDELTEHAEPPEDVLVRAERCVRRQAAAARAAFVELDGLARSFAGGGAPIVIWGSGAGRRFPDPRVPAFAGVDVLVDERDLAAFEACAETHGFVAGRKEISLESREELVRGADVTVELATVRMNPDEVSRRANVAPPSNREAALASLRASARDELHGDLLRVTVVPMPRVALASAVEARAKRGRLFDIPRLVDLERRLGGLDWSDVVFPSRLFEWGRYGPESLARFTTLRGAYYIAYSLRSTRGIPRKLAYLARSPLPRVVSRFARDGVAAIRGRRVEASQLAYWAQPEVGAGR